MPRYYFDVHNGDMVRDTEGMEFSNRDEVRRRASNLLLSLIDDIMQMGNEKLDCRIFVRDQSDEIIYMGTFTYSGSWINAALPSEPKLAQGGPSLVYDFAAASTLRQLFTPGR